MDPRAPFSFTQLLKDGNEEQTSSQSQTPSHIGGFGQFQNVASGFSHFAQQPDFHALQYQQFLFWQQQQLRPQLPQQHQPIPQQYQPIPQQHQPIPQPSDQQHVVPPADECLPAKKNTKKGKSTAPVVRHKWPASDEVLLATAVVSVSVNPITSNYQNDDAFWEKIANHYAAGGPKVPRTAKLLSSHWHMIKSKVNRFNELYLTLKSRYKSGWSDDKFIEEANMEFNNDQSNPNHNPFTYDHVWRVVKDTSKWNTSTKVHGNQLPKRTKTSSTGEYTSSASDANFGSNQFDPNEFGISLDDDNDDIQAEQQPPVHVEPEVRPIGRDKAKAMRRLKGKAKGGESSASYTEKKLVLVEDLSEVARVQKHAYETFDAKMEKFYALEEQKMAKKIEIKEKKLLFIDTSRMNPRQLAEHEAMCEEIRQKYNMNRYD